MLSTGKLAGGRSAAQADTVPHTDMQMQTQLGAQGGTQVGTEWDAQGGTQGVAQGVAQGGTQAQTQGERQGGTQGGTQAGAQAGPTLLSGRVRPKTVTPGSRRAQAARQAGGGQTTAGAGAGLAGAGAAGAGAAEAGAAARQQATPLPVAAVASSLEGWQPGVDDVRGGAAGAAGAAAAAFHISGKRPHRGEGEDEVRLAKKAGQQGPGRGSAVDGWMQGAALEVLGTEPAARDGPAKRPELWQPADGEEDDARVALGLMTMEEVRRERAQARAAAAAAGEAGAWA